MGGTVDQTGQTAALLANQFASALDTVSKSETAARLAAASTNKDAYSIAGLLADVGQDTKLKVASLMKDVAAGKITMDEAIQAAQNVANSQITTVEDIINALSGYVGTHVATVNAFENGLDVSKSAITTAVNKAIGEHQAVQADALADLATEAAQMATLKNQLVGDSGTIATLQAERETDIEELESYVHATLQGSNSALIERKRISAPIALIQSRRDSNPVTPTITDAIRDAQTQLASAKTQAATAAGNLNAEADDAMHRAQASIQEILAITASALQV